MTDPSEAVRHYLDAYDWPDPQAARRDAEYVLSQCLWPGHDIVIVDLAVILASWRGPIPTLLNLDLLKALHLAVAMVDAEVARPVDGHSASEMAGRVMDRVLGAYAERHEALAAAVRQLGGAEKVAIPSWMAQAISDTETWTPCDCVVDRVELAVRNTFPGRRVTPWVGGLGHVLYSGVTPADQAASPTKARQPT